MGELKKAILLISLISIIIIVGIALIFLLHFLPISDIIKAYLFCIIVITIVFGIVAACLIQFDEDDKDKKDSLFNKDIKFIFRLWLIFFSWASILLIITLIALTYENKITNTLAIISYVLSAVLLVAFYIYSQIIHFSNINIH
jgi:hypothetical protein